MNRAFFRKPYGHPSACKFLFLYFSGLHFLWESVPLEKSWEDCNSSKGPVTAMSTVNVRMRLFSAVNIEICAAAAPPPPRLIKIDVGKSISRGREINNLPYIFYGFFKHSKQFSDAGICFRSFYVKDWRSHCLVLNWPSAVSYGPSTETLCYGITEAIH